VELREQRFGNAGQMSRVFELGLRRREARDMRFWGEV